MGYPSSGMIIAPQPTPLPEHPSARNNKGPQGKRRGKLTQREKLKRYQHDVELAQKVMEPFHKDWRRHIEFYKGNQWLMKNGADITPRDGVVINQIASIINTITPAITTQPPTLRATPMRPEDEERAPLVEAILNYEWNRLDVSEELKVAAKDMLIMGNAFIKVGHEYVAEELPRDPDDVDLDVQRIMAQQAGVQGQGALGDLPDEYAAEEAAAMDPMGGAEGAPLPPGGGAEAGSLPPEQGTGFSPEEGMVPPDQGGEVDPMALMGQDQQMGLEQQALDEEDMAMADQELAMEQAQAEPTGPPLILTEDEIRALIPKTETIVRKDDIFVERVSPFDLFVDPEARDLSEAKWVAQRVVRALEDVKNDPNLKNTSRLRATEETKVRSGQKPKTEDQRYLGEYVQRVVLWEYYNLHDRTLCIFADGHDTFLYEGQYTYPFLGSPFVMIRDYQIPDELWAYGEVTMVEGPQVELNKIRTAQLVHTRRTRRKHLYRRESFDPEGIAAMQSDEDGTLVPVAAGQPLAEAIQPIPDQATAMPTDWYQMSNVVESDLTTLSGVSDYQRGEFLPRHVTASEANLMSQAQDLRARDKLDRIERAASDIGAMIKSLAQTFYDTERWALIVGNGQTVPVQFTKEDIQGEYDVKVDASSTQPTNEVFKQQQTERMYQLLRPDPLIKGDELIKLVLDAYGIKNPSRYILSPEEQMLQQLQGMMGGEADPSVTGTQPGQAEGNVEGGADLQDAIAGGQEAAIS